MEIITNKVKNRYNYIKRLINNNNDIKILIDGQFYFNEKAFNYIEKFDKNYFMNKYYNLTSLDFLLMIDESDNIYDIQNKLFEKYETLYASSVWSCFVEVLGRDI